MNLLICRRWYGQATLGELYLDGQYFCLSQEPPPNAPVRQLLLPTIYRVGLVERGSDSAAPAILNAPRRGPVYICGDAEQEDEGHLLVGTQRQGWGLLGRMEAFTALATQVRAAIKKGWKVWMEIAHTPDPGEVGSKGLFSS